MKVLMVAAEVAPYSTVGGLSQVVHFLSNQLRRQGVDVRVFTPKYGVIKTKRPFKAVFNRLGVPTGYSGQKFPEELICNVVKNRVGSPPVYFLENREYYELRSNVYQYKDDHLRFFLLSRGCLEWLKKQEQLGKWVPDLIHIHDWHASYLAEDIRKNERYKELFYKTAVLLTVHNFHMQGKTNFQFLAPGKRDKGKEGLRHFFDNELILQNPLLRGIIHADWVNTVSQTHAREVLTHEYGEGLEKVLIKNRGKLSGILNGLDTKEFNPKRDSLIKHNFSLGRLDLREKNKLELQRTFGLKVSDQVPLLAYSGRLVKQKGIDLLVEVMPHVLDEFEAQFLILGGGDREYKSRLQKLARLYTDKVSLHLYPDFKLPRKIFAGADMVLLPSEFEPGGIVAIEAMRYGAVPVVRRTGGLGDIVSERNGIVFDKFDAWSFFSALIRGLQLYSNKRAWRRLVRSAMASDFSWKFAAGEYRTLYDLVIKQRKKLL